MNWRKIFKIVRWAGMRQEKRPEVIIRAEKGVIEVGAYEELPDEVVNLPGKSECLSCLPDMVPGGELEHSAECDKGVNVSNTQGGGLAGDVQNRDQRGGENTRPKKNSQLVRAKDCR